MMVFKNVLVEQYSQKGEGVVFINNKPTYVFGVIKGEIIDCEILKEEEKFNIAKYTKIVEPSINRTDIKIPNAYDIGGYELIHMNDEEQKKFKIERVKNDFKKIARTEIKNIDYFQGSKRFFYRNKITLHNGFFYKKNSNEPIEIDNYLLSDIKFNKDLKGEIVYRKLDTLIYGKKSEKKYTTDSMFGFKFRVGLNSFYQVNKEVAIEAYKEIEKNIIMDGVTLDLYSGIGTITIIASRKSKKVIGVEINKSSYKDAIFNIKNNNIENVEFWNMDVNDWIKRNSNIKIDTLILDPSREGVDNGTLQLISKSIKPKKLIYLSCNPGTQASNFNHLKNDYELKQVNVFDMFPQTYHIESLIVLERKEKTLTK